MRIVFLALVLAMLPSLAPATVMTTVIEYAPFALGDLRSDFSVSSKHRGSCFTESIALSRADAWRCTVGNRIYDPCFSDPDRPRVACPRDAFSKVVMLMTLTKPLPKRTGGKMGYVPWGLALANGARCEMETGATGMVANMRLNYACASSGWVLGDIDRVSRPWRVYYSARSDGTHYGRVAVIKAVF